MATLFKVDGTQEEFELPRQVGLDFLQNKLDGGYIEFVYFSDGSALMLDEEGKLKKLPINRPAWALAMVKNPMFMADPLVGPVVFMSAEEMQRMNEDEDELLGEIDC
jgi:hypothetical protein